MTADPQTTDDIIDSRDVIERLGELEADRDDVMNDGDQASIADWQEENGAYLEALRDLASQGEDSYEDWTYGVALVRDSHWVDYAQELAVDIDAYDPSSIRWPLSCIDWAQAARELQMDYTPVEFDGVTYWGR